MTELGYTIERVAIERTRELRKAVLRPHLPAAESYVLADDHLSTTVTFGALTPDDRVIAVGRLTPEPPPFGAAHDRGWRLRGMATDPGFRNRGIGSALLKALIGHVAGCGGGILWCNARVAARGLYERAGMRQWGEIWEEPQIGPHILMWRDVPGTAPGSGYAVTVTDNPMRSVLQSLDALDIERVIAQFAADCTLTTVFGEVAEGPERVRAVLGGFLHGLRSSRHVVGSEWNPEPGVWVAEMSATYELRDHSRRGPYARAIILRAGDHGIEDMRIYGAHEPPLAQSGRAYSEVLGAHGWLPTL